METPYRAVVFNKHDVITTDVVNQAHANYRWIEENTPRGRYFPDATGSSTEGKTVIVCGSIYFPKSKKSNTVTKEVRLGKAFSPDCVPHVTTGLVAKATDEVYVSVSGPGKRILPDSTGFRIRVEVEVGKKEKWQFKNHLTVFWQAHGLSRVEINDI